MIINTDFVNITRCNWTKTTNIALLDMNDTIKAFINNCVVMDTVLEYSNNTKGVVLLQNVKQLSLKQFLMRHSNMSINRKMYPDPEADILGLIKVVNSTNTHIVGIHTADSILYDNDIKFRPTFVERYGAVLFLSGTKSNISESTFSDTKGRAVTAKRCNLWISESNFTNNTVSGILYLEQGHGAAVVSWDTELHIDGCTFRSNSAGFYGGANGGAIYVEGRTGHDDISCTINNCTFQNNSAWRGAAVASWDTELHIDGCTFTSNSAGFYGGAMYLDGSTDHRYILSTIHNCTFDNNTASYGGAVLSDNTQLDMDSCDFTSNSAKPYGRGGAIFLQRTKVPRDINSTVHDCTFYNNTAEQGGAFGSWDTQLHMDGCTFTSNSVENVGGAIYIYRTKDHGDISSTIHHCTFDNNNASVGGGVASWDTKLRMHDCTFTSCSAAFEGGAISLLSKYQSYPILNSSIHNCIFENNTADEGGAVTSEDTQLHIEGSIFTSNSAKQYGGAVRCRGEKTSQELIISNSTLLNNTARQGGAVWSQGIRSWLHMDNCLFSSNSAKEFGGAVNCQEQETSRQSIISNAVFHDNSANLYGGALLTDKCNISLENVTIETNQTCGAKNTLPQLYFFQTHLMLLNVVLETFNQDCFPEFFDNLKFFAADSNAINYKGFTLNCPPNYIATFKRTASASIKDLSSAPCSKDSNMTCFDFIFTCKIVQSGYYILTKGSLHVVKETVRYEGNETKPCPIPGGNCTQGLRPLDGFWGPYAKDGTARFIKCAPELCCIGNECQDNTSCNSENHRNGTLCTQCEKGYSESLYSEKCVPNQNCNPWPLYVVPILVIVIVIFSVFFGVQKYVTKFYGLVSVMLKGSHGDMKAISKPESQNQPDSSSDKPGTRRGTQNEPGISGDIEQENNIHCVQPQRQISTFLLAVFTIFYYTQDVNLYHVDLASNDLPWQKRFGKMIQGIFNLQAQILEAIADETCVSEQITPVWKILLTISVYPLIYITFLGIYIVVFKFIPLCKRPNSCITLNQKITANSTQIKMNLVTGVLIVAMLSYQNVTKSALKMVKCVEVDKKVLLIDYDTICYKWWQYLIWFYVITCSIPFPIYLIFSPHLLKIQSVSVREFLIGLILPGPVILWWLLKQIIGKFRNRHIEPTEMPSDIESIHSEPGAINSIVEDDHFENSNEIDNTSENTPLLGVGNQDQPEESTQLKGILCANLEGGYKVYLNGWLNWAGIILFLRMILVFLSVLVQGTLQRILSMLSVSIFSLILYSVVKPCTKRVLNIFLVLSQAAIVCVAICYLILATFQRAEYQHLDQDPVSSALRTVIYVFSVLIPASCVLILAIDFVVRIIVALVLFLSKCIRRARG